MFTEFNLNIPRKSDFFKNIFRVIRDTKGLFYERFKLDHPIRDENTPDTILWYQFEDNVLDTSGNGYNGTATDITYAPGVFGQAAVFNGTSSRIECGALPAFNVRSEFSISIWCKIAANPISELSIVGHINYNNYQIKLLENGRTNAVVRLNDGSFLNTSTSANLNDGLWHHLVMVYSVSNGFLRYYVDNILIAQEATSQLLTDNLVSLNLGFSDGRNLNGSLDEFRFYNRALTQEEITENNNNGYHKFLTMKPIVVDTSPTGDQMPYPLDPDTFVAKVPAGAGIIFTEMVDGTLRLRYSTEVGGVIKRSTIR